MKVIKLASMTPKVRQVAQDRWRDVLLAFGIDPSALSGRHGPCPMCGGVDRFRFDDREGRGTYYCSHCGAGDGVQLVMRYSGLDFHTAAQQIERVVGGGRPRVEKTKRTVEDTRGALRRVWEASSAIQIGDEAFQYLRTRGLQLDELPEAIHTHPSLRLWDGEIAHSFPAMVAKVTAPSGKALTIHRTYLKDARKAPVANPKRLMPAQQSISGAAIRLAPLEACVGIAEGIETALAVRELFDVPCWSCISASGMNSFEPPDGVRKVILFADNDPNAAGTHAADSAAQRLSRRGYEVDVVIPPVSGDWLDELNRRKAARAAEGKDE